MGDIMADTELNAKTIALIDSLKTTTGEYGLANGGSEYRIITEIFLYKFLKHFRMVRVLVLLETLHNRTHHKHELLYANTNPSKMDVFGKFFLKTCLQQIHL